MKGRLLRILDLFATALFPIGVVLLLGLQAVFVFRNPPEVSGIASLMESWFLLIGVTLHLVVLRLATRDEKHEFIPIWGLVMMGWMNRLSAFRTTPSEDARSR